nr:MAG TPA: hypothetical protein [Caudoviricetes sp.]
MVLSHIVCVVGSNPLIRPTTSFSLNGNGSGSSKDRKSFKTKSTEVSFFLVSFHFFVLID